MGKLGVVLFNFIGGISVESNRMNIIPHTILERIKFDLCIFSIWRVKREMLGHFMDFVGVINFWIKELDRGVVVNFIVWARGLTLNFNRIAKQHASIS